MPATTLRSPNTTGEVFDDSEMDVIGQCFGLRFVTGGAPEGIVELYIEDDENFFFKVSFNHFWFDDLMQVLQKGKEEFPK